MEKIKEIVLKIIKILMDIFINLGLHLGVIIKLN